MMTNTKISKWFEVRMENKLSVGPNIHLPVSTLVIPEKKNGSSIQVNYLIILLSFLLFWLGSQEISLVSLR